MVRAATKLAQAQDRRLGAVISELAPGHVFWPDDVGLLDSGLIALDTVLHSRHVTDTDLLARAVRNDGRLATFDGRLRAHAVTDGAEALLVIPAA